jgi:hypothetical protein
MSGVLKKSLASWSEKHGFGILCIHSPLGEHFAIVPADGTRARGLGGRIAEAGLRAHLTQVGLSAVEVDEAVDLAREWATTITGRWPLSS